MKFFIINATCQPQKPLPKKVEIKKTVVAEKEDAVRMAENRGFYRASEVHCWWELEHSQTIMCELSDGSFMEVQKKN